MQRDGKMVLGSTDVPIAIGHGASVTYGVVRMRCAPGAGVVARGEGPALLILQGNTLLPLLILQGNTLLPLLTLQGNVHLPF